MNKMMAHRLYGPKDLRWTETDLPKLEKNDVLIKVKYCGVCGTDYAIYSGASSFWDDGLIKVPMTLGHEYCGVIEDVGSEVKTFKRGDRVVADMAVSCGVCENCRKGNYMSCKVVQCVGTVNAYDGGYAEYTVMPERHLFHLPESVSFKQGALVEPVATGLNAINVCNIEIGDTVVIIGTGPIGLGSIPFAKMSGARQIILLGRKEFKLDIGKKLGADITINTTIEDYHTRIMELTEGNGADVIIEASGSERMLHESFSLANYGCRISLVAFYEKLLNNLNIDQIIVREIQLKPVMGSPNLGSVVIKMMESKKVDFTSMITTIMPLKDAKKALDTLKEGSNSRIKILLEA